MKNRTKKILKIGLVSLLLSAIPISLSKVCEPPNLKNIVLSNIKDNQTVMLGDYHFFRTDTEFAAELIP